MLATIRRQMKQPVRLSRTLVALVLAVAAASASLTAGCASPPEESTADRVKPAEKPAAPDLSTPESAVRAYTDWISYSYRTLDSDAASPTCSPAEAVRVDSYVEYNRQQGRAIEQQLVSAEYEPVLIGSSKATVTGSEQWEYRYLDPAATAYLGSTRAASYEVTYTVVPKGPSTWVVDSVRASSPGSR